MTTPTIIRLVLLALVFAAWAALMLRTLTTLRQRARDGGGGFAPQLARWLRDPGDRRDRSTLLFLGFVLAAMIFMQVALPAA
ncbi:hypothetical protein P6F26_18645 [Roseibacterium sp. SDUM158017]|uniref:hypothetical protein n=1 Tax=Roseicyclus salinarum TaxID=3036773 RepID=UPI00241589DB|nr:hypothetical protein [Roseibacterium sp. SDUM158017]MDG4650467.1 hypothetical protein [Roseibacterium sp. SDUM158017]